MAITLTPQTDMNPVPRVSVAFAAADIPATANIVTLHAIVDGRDFPVRGAIQRTFSSTITLIDYEAAFGTPIEYVVEAWNGINPLGRQSLGTVTLNVTTTVVQQPLDPTLSSLVKRVNAFARTTRRSTPTDLTYPEGRVLPTLVATGPRRALSGVDLELLVTADQADKLQDSLGTYSVPQLPVWLIRTPPPQRLPRVFFCHVPTLEERDLELGKGLTYVMLTATVDEVAAPAPGLVVPFLTYSDIDAGYATYALKDAAYASYYLSDAAYSLAGLT